MTAGGTREPIDPVRYLGNRSSGRMGERLAAEAAARGAAVHLVTAVEAETELPGGEIGAGRDGGGDARGLPRLLPSTRLVLMAAAVADFRVEHPAPSKLHRSGPAELSCRWFPTSTSWPD